MDNIGILDPKGYKNNPLTDKPYTSVYRELGDIWSTFPVYKKAREHIQDIIDNQVIIITSETGSGKSVLFPKFALHAYKYKGKIGMTLPKQILTKSAAEFAAKTLDVNVGEHIGYIYKGSPAHARGKDPNILYLTDGTVVAMLLNDPKLPMFDCIVVDEIHERKTQIDFLLYLLKKTLSLRPEFKVILMSATIDTSIFKNYYEGYKTKEISISGRTHPVTSYFLDKSINPNKILNEGLKIILDILAKDTEGDILFFITSKNEAYTLCKMLYKHIKDSEITSFNPYCIELFAGVDPKKQELAQDKDMYKTINSYNRKIVVSTNVAESSLTVDGVVYVIDSGLELHGEYDPVNRAKKLDIATITQAQAQQRKGRAGRTRPGICYHLYTKDDMAQMVPYPQPDIRTSDISSECLRLMNIPDMNMKKLINMFTEFIEPPWERYIVSGLNILMQLGAIEKNAITELGKKMIKVGSSSPMLSLALVLSKTYTCSYEMVKIVSLIDAINSNIGNLFYQPKREEKDKLVKLIKIKRKFRHKYGDHHSLLHIYDKFIKTKNKMEWCNMHMVKYNILSKAKRYYYKTIKQLRQLTVDDMDIYEEVNKTRVDDRILVCLIMSHRLQTARYKRKFYETKTAKARLAKGFLSLRKTMPSHVLYTEMMMSRGRTNLNVVSVIPKTYRKYI